MMVPLVTLAIFAVSFLSFVGCFRSGIGRRHPIPVLAGMLMTGGAVAAWYCLTHLDPAGFPVTALVLYMAASSVTITVSMTPLLGDESPSSKILVCVMHRREMSAADLRALFSDRQLVAKRIGDMLAQQWITEHNGTYTVTPRGHLLASAIGAYRRMLGMRLSG